MVDPYQVLITDPISEDGIRLLTNAGIQVHLHVDKTGPEFEAARERSHGWIIRSGTRITKDELAKAPRLKVIGRAGVGVDNVDLEEASHRGIVVMNTPDVNTISAAEHTLALLLSLSRHIPQAFASLSKGRWNRSRWIGTELMGKTLGVIGLGKIGREVAKRAAAFGMQILGYDPYVRNEDLDEEVIHRVKLDNILRDSDYITLHVPLNDETRGLIGAHELNVMKPTCRLINVARGGIVDEVALAEALKAGTIAGSAIDVFSQEPLDRHHPLLGIDRCVVTPHLGASTQEAKQRVSKEICTQVRDALLERKMRNVVNHSHQT